MNFHWYLPTHGDGRDLIASAHHLEGPTRTHRAPSLAYMKQIATAAEYAGFEGVLLPTGVHCQDPWLAAAATAQYTTRLKPIVAFRPGLMQPAVAAQSVATLQQLTGNRLLLNVVTGGSAREQRAYGDFLDHDQRYARTGEFLKVVRGVFAGPGFSHHGEHYRIEDGGLLEPLPHRPPIYFGGASEAAERVSAEHADVHLLWGETLAMLRERIASLRERAAAFGRSLRFGLRVHVITRDKEEEAWAEAKRLLEGIPAGAIEAAQRGLGSLESVGQARMLSLHKGRGTGVRELEVAPNLWAGVSLVRGGAGTALVGSHEQVAERVAEYRALGIDTFIFSGYPNLEEAVRVGEQLLPLLRQTEQTRTQQPSGTRTAATTAPTALSSR